MESGRQGESKKGAKPGLYEKPTSFSSTGVVFLMGENKVHIETCHKNA